MPGIDADDRSASLPIAFSSKQGRWIVSSRGDRLCVALDARGVNKQQALAAELMVHESAITRWKNDQSMSLQNATALATALDISLDWLLLGRGSMDMHKMSARLGGGLNVDGKLRPYRLSAHAMRLLADAMTSIADDVQLDC